MKAEYRAGKHAPKQEVVELPALTTAIDSYIKAIKDPYYAVSALLALSSLRIS